MVIFILHIDGPHDGIVVFRFRIHLSRLHFHFRGDSSVKLAGQNGHFFVGREGARFLLVEIQVGDVFVDFSFGETGIADVAAAAR